MEGALRTALPWRRSSVDERFPPSKRQDRRASAFPHPTAPSSLGRRPLPLDWDDVVLRMEAIRTPVQGYVHEGDGAAGPLPRLSASPLYRNVGQEEEEGSHSSVSRGMRSMSPLSGVDFRGLFASSSSFISSGFHRLSCRMTAMGESNDGEEEDASPLPALAIGGDAGRGTWGVDRASDGLAPPAGEETDDE